MALALLTPIAIEVAKSIGMGAITTGLDTLSTATKKKKKVKFGFRKN